MATLNSKRVKWFAMIVGLISVGLMVWGTAFNYTISEKGSSRESQWVSALFVPLVGAQLLSLFTLWQRRVHPTYYKFFLVCTTVATVSVSLNWLFYLSKNEVGWFSYIALAEIVVLLSFVAVMTAATMMSPRGVKPDRLRAYFEKLRYGVREQPAWTLMLFVILFLSVGYLFGFALAFHDQASLASGKDVPALRMENLKSPDDPPDPATKAKAEPTPTPSEALKEVDLSRPLFESRGSEYFFYFDKADAYLPKTKADCTRQVTPPPRETLDLTKPDQFNYCHLLALTNKILADTAKGTRVRVTLIGHTDNEPPVNAKYKSNYELSQARAQNVQHEVLALLKDDERWRNVEWFINAASDEAIPEMFHGTDEAGVLKRAEINLKATRLNRQEKAGLRNLLENLKGKNQGSPEKTSLTTLREKNISLSTVAKGLSEPEKRVVLVFVEQIKDHITSRQSVQLAQSSFRKMKLLDYMYFSIYTITTTGYGDIVPTSAYAKFLATFANICEVLFLVVFFNSLLSLKEGLPGAPPQKSRSRSGRDRAQLQQPSNKSTTPGPIGIVSRQRSRSNKSNV